MEIEIRKEKEAGFRNCRPAEGGGERQRTAVEDGWRHGQRGRRPDGSVRRAGQRGQRGQRGRRTDGSVGSGGGRMTAWAA